MELKELMDGFAAKIGLEGFAPDQDGAYMVSFDEMEVGFREDDDGKAVLIIARFAEKPTEGTDRLAEILMAANYLFVSTAGSTIALDNESKSYVLQRRESLMSHDVDSFMAVIEKFVNALEEFKTLVADFRPAFAEAEEIAAEESARFSSLSPNGFLQV